MDVRLVETDPRLLASYRKFVTTHGLLESSAKVNVKVEVSNDGLQPIKGTVITTIFDPKWGKADSMKAPFSTESENYSSGSDQLRNHDFWVILG